MRIVSWNIESLPPILAELPTLVEELAKPDVLCLQEARIRPQDTAEIARMIAALPGYLCRYSLNRDPKNVTFRGGRAHGVVTYVKKGFRPDEGEVPEWDREGRIVITRVRGIAIGNVYAVNGTDRPYFDHALDRVDGDRHAFKRRFQDQVLARARGLRAFGGVVMAGDWNVSQTKLDTHPRLRTEAPHVLARAELERHLTENGMVDIYRHLFPDARAFTWFNLRAPQGRLDAARVDYILVSEDLVPRVREAAVLADFRGRTKSDHVPVVVELVTS